MSYRERKLLLALADLAVHTRGHPDYNRALGRVVEAYDAVLAEIKASGIDEAQFAELTK